MGKKSKKKSRPAQPGQRERLNTDHTDDSTSQERRQQQGQQQQQQRQEHPPRQPRQPQQNYHLYAEPQDPPPAVALRNSKRGHWENRIEVYDRIWYLGGTDDNDQDNWTYQRGIVRAKSELDEYSSSSCSDDDDGDDKDEATAASAVVEYQILPVDAPDEPDRFVIRHAGDKLLKDHFNWELRFQEGDKVVCHVRLKEDQPQQFWVPATVTQLWATDANQQAVWPYLCTLDKPAQRHASERYFRHLICDDNDQCIILRNSIFRFALGSTVIFNSKRALFVGMRPDPQSIPKWVPGTVCKVECLGNAQIYAAYKCSFVVNNKLEYCLIHVDDDEHVADPETSPRQRLLDAIEQSCSYAHIDYLIQESKLDVSSFQELLVNKAIRHGSYDALLWFQENANVNLETVRDDEDNGLLHQILRGKGATEFFIKMARYYSQKRSIKIDFGFSGLNKKRGLAQTNNLGQTVLHSIVADDDMPVLSAAFATRLDRILGLSYFYGNGGGKGLSELRDVALANGNQIMAKMVQELECYRGLFHIKQALLYGRGESFDSLLANFGQEPKPSIARRLARMLREEKEITRSVYSLTQKLIIGGERRALRWLFQADPELKTILSWKIRPTVDAHEFAQPELFHQFRDERDQSNAEIDVDVVALAAHGAQSSISWDEDMSAMYANLLDGFIGGTTSEVRHLAMYLEIFLSQSHDRSFKDLAVYKLRQLRDDDSLPNRLEILNYLVRDQGLAMPNAIDVIRWRQGGVLRWLVKESLIDLKEPAITSKHIQERWEVTTFLGTQELPGSMTTGQFFCFAAVEFDDLQTIQWLTDTQRLPVKTFLCNGWNLMHACAFYGRTEIAHWLVTGSHLKPLVRAVSQRKPWDMRYSTHLALERGFTYLTTLLISWGCPTEDTNCRSVESIAKESSFAHVVKWGEEKDKPIVLKNAVQELLRLLAKNIVNLEAVKQHITKSKCLDFEKWDECNYHNAEISGPLGLSYVNVVEKCCLSRNKEFTVWLCTVALCSKGKHFKLIQVFWDPNNFWEEVEDKVDWIMIFRLLDDKILLSLQESPWGDEIVCTDPASKYPLRKLSEVFNDDETIMQHLFEAAHEIIRRDVLEEFIRHGIQFVHRLLARGETVQAITAALEAIADAAAAFGKYEDVCLASYFEGSPVTIDGHLNVDGRLRCNYKGHNPLRWQMLWRSKAAPETKLVYLVLAAEGYEDLFLWSIGSSTGWNAEKERVATRIAAYRGYGKIVNFFLKRQFAAEFHSARSARFYAAILGAAESGRIDDLEAYSAELAKHDKSLGPILDFDFSHYGETYDQSPSYVGIAMASSLIIVAIYGCISDSKDPRLPEPVCLPNPRGYELLNWVALKSGFDSQRFLEFVAFLLERVSDWDQLERGIYVVKFLSEEMGLNAWACQDDIGRICRRYMSAVACDKKDPSRGLKLMVDLLNVVSALGLEIQSIAYEDYFGDVDKIFIETLAEMQTMQRKQWSSFDAIKEGGSLEEIQDGVNDGFINLDRYDCHGLQLVHLSAAYDRLDVLQWLIEAKHAALSDQDGSGRSVLQVALDSHAVACVEWSRRRKAAETISSFLSSRYNCRIELICKRAKLHLIGLIQAWSRGYRTRRLHKAHFVTRLEASQRFKAIWEDATCLLVENESGRWTSWTDLKHESYDIAQGVGQIKEDDLYDTVQVLGEAGKRVLVEPKKQVGFYVDIPVRNGIYHSKETDLPPRKKNGSKGPHCSEILLTKDVVKWLRVGDSKYREFFVRRMEQLAAGDRSQTLAKRLSGCKSVIYETYLEQKSGFRILWTETPDCALLIWYVAKHKSVSRLLDLIDNARSRSSRRLTSATKIITEGNHYEGIGLLHDSQPLLDPRGDTPLKLYNVPTNDIEKLGNGCWDPPLHLTRDEKEIVETEGTVLVLGRSGTGKTICICNRMDFDRHKAKDKESFAQLFVARSSRLCNYVKATVESNDFNLVGVQSRQFTTFHRLIQSLENNISRTGSEGTLFLPSQRVDFSRFKREIWKSSSRVDGLVVWTSIRSFIKGSIEAVQQQRPLTEEEYLSIGKKRCRLSQETQQSVYALFEKYSKYCTEWGLWDDCDRVSSLLTNLDTESQNLGKKPHYDKIYVDEVQDYTQAEIALFFKLCDPGGLFLAGDPAQSVVEGVEFRFEDIRSVGHHLFEADRRLIPDKPRAVNTNFRSHSGILNVAAAILDKLFEAYPDSAKLLNKDRGLFAGPRPSVLQKVDFACLKELISKTDGVVILTHDDATAIVKQQLGYSMVYGIREAKGLEFNSVILLDFFRHLPSQNQIWFRELFLGREVHGIRDGCPELESSLKLLYTAVTRCIQRLVFAETSKSMSGDAFARWITSAADVSDGSSLAVRQTVDDFEKLSYTPDEWTSMGLENAMSAESTSAALEAESWLEKAIYCFDQGGELSLAKRARIHKASAQFRVELENPGQNGCVSDESLEFQCARIVEQLITQGLVLEAKRVIESVLPFLTDESQSILQERLLSKLPSMEDSV